MSDLVLGDGVGAYVRLLRHAPASVPMVSAALARWTLSMTPLGILVLVEQEREAYALAGLVTGAYAIGSALGTPVWGRLMDRVGQVRVLLPTTVLSALFLALLAVSVPHGVPAAGLAALAAAAGLTYPALGPALRTSIRFVFADHQSRRVAFSLDATSVELAFVGGPLLISGLLLAPDPRVPVLATAGLLLAGGLAYCLTPAARGADRGVAATEPGSASTPRSALAAPGVIAVLVVMLMLSVGFGQLDTSITATADEVLGDTRQVGLLFAAIAGGSTVGGLAYGARTWMFDERRGVAVLLGLFGALLGVLAMVLATTGGSLLVLLPVLLLAGLTIAPTLILQQMLLDRLAPASRLNEAQAFLSASNTSGAAIGTALAGLVIDAGGVPWSFAGAALAVLVAAGLAAGHRHRWRQATAAPVRVPVTAPAAPATARRR